MQAATFWRTVTRDDSGLLGEILDLLSTKGIRYAVIGGQAVNAFVEPVVSLDLDLVVEPARREELAADLEKRFEVTRFEDRLNVTKPGSDLRIQIQLDPRYADFVERASAREVLGVVLSVADLRDVLQGKVWAASDDRRRPSKRQKDLADIARIIERRPELRGSVPRAILDKLI